MEMRPRYCSVLVTSACPLRCRMCRMWEAAAGDNGVTAGEWKEVFSQLKNVLAPGAEICFTGGEPLMKPGIIELIRHAARSGFHTGLNSNGYLLDREAAERLAAASLWSITLSLESLSEETHDAMRGVRGSYRKVRDAIGYLLPFAEQVQVGVATVISDANAQDAAELALWVQGQAELRAIRFQALMQPLATPKADDWHEDERYNALWPKDRERIAAALERLIELKEAGKLAKLTNPVRQLRVFQSYFEDPRRLPTLKNCIFYQDVMNINQSGDVYLCPNMGAIGNVRSQAVETIWHSERAAGVRDAIRQCPGSCNFVVNCFWE